MSRLSFLLFPLLLLHIANAQVKQCYYLGGRSSSTDYPCNPEAETSTCCGGDWICGTNLYCESKGGDKYQGSCTDSKWDINNNPACPFALNYDLTEPGYDYFDYELNTTRCTNTNPQTLCPNNDFSTSNETCCEAGQGILEINYQNSEPLPTAKADLSCTTPHPIVSFEFAPILTVLFLAYYALAGYTIPTDGVYTPVTAFSSSASSTSTSSASAAAAATTSPANPAPAPSTEEDSSSSLSTGAKAGIGIGVAAVVCAIACAAIFFYIRRRKQTKHDREQPAMSNYPQYSNVPQHAGPGQERPMEYYKSSELADDSARMELDARPLDGNRRASEMPG
ncbi:MAG: hypothetical protein Q9215_001076 [Flavoplaca cf. flavocitrina]